MRRKIRLYIHNSHYEPIAVKRKLSASDLVTLVIRQIAQGIFVLCYVSGLALILIPKTLVQLIRALNNPKRIIGNIREHFTQVSTRQSFGVFLSLILLSNLLFIGSQAMAKGQMLKADIMRESQSGLSALGEAAGALEAGDYTRADRLFNDALNDFLQSQQILNDTSLVLKSALKLVPQGQDATRLLEAIILVTELGIEANQNIEMIKSIKVGPQGLAGTENPQAALERIILFSNEAENKIQRVSSLIEKVNPYSLPDNQQSLFLLAKQNIATVKNGVGAFQGLMAVAEKLLLGERTFLLAFLNNNELRPGGGFMGTIGTARISNGVISELDVRTVYDYDGQLKELIHVPQPMLLANNRWFLRDTNWFADNRVNAFKANRLLEKSVNKKVDAVIKMTPALVIDALRRTGPITLSQHNVTLTAENFIETTQVATSLTYDKYLNQPKQVLADFIPALLQKISDQEDSIQFFLTLILSHLQDKNVQIFSFDKSTQSLIEPYNWSGAIVDTDRDYLSVVQANLGGTKTNNELVTTLNLTSQVESNGKIINELEYIVQNPLPNMDRLENKSFVRFLVPLNSKLISADGFDEITTEDPIKDIRYANDPDVKKWNESLSYLPDTKTYTGTESNKSFFGGWIEVRGGETQTIKLKYELPFKINKIDKQSLLIQKQVGSELKFNYNLVHTGRERVWDNGKINREDSSAARFQGMLSRDALISVVLQQ